MFFCRLGARVVQSFRKKRISGPAKSTLIWVAVKELNLSIILGKPYQIYMCIYIYTHTPIMVSLSS